MADAWARAAVERAPAGSVLHAVGDEGVPTPGLIADLDEGHYFRAE